VGEDKSPKISGRLGCSLRLPRQERRGLCASRLQHALRLRCFSNRAAGKEKENKIKKKRGARRRVKCALRPRPATPIPE